MSHTVNAPKKNTSKKAQAILAGGLVLGVGAIVTLASWTDQEKASGAFQAGSFNIESSLTGDENSFKNHAPDKDGLAELTFDLTGANNMTPNHTVSAPLVLRLDKKTTHNADIELTAASVDDENPNADNPNVDNLTYRIVEVDEVSKCTPEATGKTLAEETSLGDLPTAKATFDLSKGTDAAGEPVNLCFLVTADAGLEQGHLTTASWTFAGESK